MDYSGVISSVKGSIAAVIDFDENQQITGHGTGFLYQRSDILVTCNHVVDGDKPFVWFREMEEKPVPAEVVLRNIEHDIAILKIGSSDRVPIKSFAGEVQVGMPVIFPGYPFEWTSLTAHQGIISGISIDDGGTKNYSIDGSVNGGNSGGPLLSKDGELIGIVNASRRVNMDVIEQVRGMAENHLAVGGLDITKILQMLTRNLQLGIGYAVPHEYVPKYTGPKAKKAPKEKTQ
jgi:S1-C subfamily serine protease